jgi:MFS family permease
MIESFNVPKKDIGYWAGIASAVFSVGQCIAAIPWVRASDRYGRKPIILLAMFCVMSSSLLFGFSRNLAWCIAARVCAGASNGNVGILRTTVAEMVPQRSLQPRAFAILPFVWQIGAILGPIIGGSLATPARKFPQLFGRSKFLKAFPYALPNLVAAVIFTIGILAGILFLKESLESRKRRKDYGLIAGKCLTSCCRSRRSELRPADDFESNLPSSIKVEVVGPPKYREVFSYQSNLNLVAYMLLGFHGVAYDQLIPVFMHLPVHHGRDAQLPFKFSGGFGLESGRIGLIFTLYGTVSMLAQFLLFPPLTRRLGALFCYRACTLVFPLIYLVTPYTVLMPTDTGRQAAIVSAMMVKGLANVFAYPCITIMMTNSVRELRLLGTLNGVATSLGAIGRACGPYLAGKTFTWGAHAGFMIASWWLLAAFALAGHIVTWWLFEMEGFSAVPQEDPDDELEIIALDSRGVLQQNGAETEMFVEGENLEEFDEDDDTEIVEDKPLIRKKEDWE